jgi:hypothetical protein
MCGIHQVLRYHNLEDHNFRIRPDIKEQDGPGSSVGIATDYGMDGPESNPGGGGRYFPPVQTGPGAEPASCTMGTGVKSGQGVTLTTHPLLVPRS